MRVPWGARIIKERGFAMLKIAKMRCALALAAAAAFFVVPAHANDDGFIDYEVKSGDTLYELSKRYLNGPNASQKVQKINRLADPRKLPIARVLKIPRELLRSERIELRVEGFSGPVQVAGRTPVVGSVLGEGEVITTGRSGFVTFSAANGAKVSLPSNTRARLMKARRYLLDDILDMDFSILSGRGNAVSPKLGPQGRMRMHTPSAVTAVRGTEFRVAHSEEDGRSLTEVVEGKVAVAAGSDQKLTAAGFGVASTADGVGANEALLPAPSVEDPGAMQTGKTLVFNITPEAGASGTRTQIARDAGFVEVVDEQIVADGPVEFQTLDNGRYFVRARAISASGLEGLSEVYSFRRKRLDVAADVAESPLEGGYLFKWLPEGEGQTFFAFQMWRDGDLETMIVDETGMSETGIVLTNLQPGAYQWRVAAMQADEDGLLKIWGPEQKLTVSE